MQITRAGSHDSGDVKHQQSKKTFPSPYLGLIAPIRNFKFHRVIRLATFLCNSFYIKKFEIWISFVLSPWFLDLVSPFWEAKILEIHKIDHFWSCLTSEHLVLGSYMVIHVSFLNEIATYFRSNWFCRFGGEVAG